MFNRGMKVKVYFEQGGILTGTITDVEVNGGIVLRLTDVDDLGRGDCPDTAICLNSGGFTKLEFLKAP